MNELDEMLSRPLPIEAPRVSSADIMALVGDRVRRRRRAKQVRTALASVIVLGLLATLIIRRPEVESRLGTTPNNPSTVRTDRWVVDGQEPTELSERPLRPGDTLEIFGTLREPIGLEHWIVLSVFKPLKDYDYVAVEFADSRSETFGGVEFGVGRWRDQTQVVFSDDDRNFVALSAQGVDFDRVVETARLLAARPGPYTLRGLPTVEGLPLLVSLGPTDPRPLVAVMRYGGLRYLTTVAIARGYELRFGVRDQLRATGAFETVAGVEGWRHSSEGRSWITYQEGSYIALGDTSIFERLRHPSVAEWDQLLRTTPPGPGPGDEQAGWFSRWFGLTSPCKLMSEVLAASPGDDAWRSALRRYAQRVERDQLADAARALVDRSDPAARLEAEQLSRQRPPGPGGC